MNVIHIQIPPLRQRRSDIPLLLEWMLKKNDRSGLPCSLSKNALKVFLDYDWPGNVRELESTVERLLLYREDSVISQKDALYALGDRDVSPSPADFDGMSLAQMESMMIQRALVRHGASLEGKKQAAKELGISLSTLYEKLRKTAQAKL